MDFGTLCLWILEFIIVLVGLFAVQIPLRKKAIR